jgi:hypothetical protein
MAVLGYHSQLRMRHSRRWVLGFGNPYIPMSIAEAEVGQLLAVTGILHLQLHAAHVLWVPTDYIVPQAAQHDV